MYNTIHIDIYLRLRESKRMYSLPNLIKRQALPLSIHDYFAIHLRRSD